MANKEKVRVENYEVNPYTMMIRPILDKSHTYAEIIETSDTFVTACKPIEIVKRSCKYFGSSYKGRREGTRQLIGITHKAPIIVDPLTSIFLFPTASPLSPQCIWISHDCVASHQKKGSNSTIVTFCNNESYEIPISSHSFANQLSRTAMLRIKFTQNMKRMEIFTKNTSELRYKASEQKGAYRFSE